MMVLVWLNMIAVSLEAKDFGQKETFVCECRIRQKEEFDYENESVSEAPDVTDPCKKIISLPLGHIRIVTHVD